MDDEASGYEADFRRYVAGRQRALLRTAWLLTGDWGTAEDLVQTALVRAWPHWRRIGGGGPGADAYVRRIMVNKATDWRSRRWRGEVPTEPLPDLPTALGRSRELHELLVDALRTLPPRQRTAVVLRYFDDLTEAATAEAMGCAVGTVKSQTARGLAALRRHPALSELELEGSAS